MKKNKICWPMVCLDIVMLCALAFLAFMLCTIAFIVFKIISVFWITVIGSFIAVVFAIVLSNHLFRKDSFFED